MVIRRMVLVFTLMMTGGCAMTENVYESKTLEGDEAVKLIDSMRAKGSYEAARARLNDTAEIIAEHIVSAVAGQTWAFSDDAHGLDIKRQGLPCEELAGDVARRPMADPVVFGRTFSAEEFATAADIVRQEATQYGAGKGSSLFDDPARRDYEVSGNGYQFNLGQAKVASLNITGDCFLMQRVVDLPPGRLPSP
ncbi:putative lipoprotein LPPB [Mycolicibacterium mageritense DSM 44476 = CIP 104973]|uniref:Lipoprotein LppB n=1 Tax=Mycolicibacterium mageritense TaxID=53462 RepID=A0ABN5Y442_MYCME|nr:LppA family lipoprotein [Mycolicibacterium mageritense]MCC9185035.1 LppA family lipoprotein [Mycolicibacterium mageritense]BBX32983.1 putative lipoprotein LppB [Mycolicibacterium mageritense]CDO21418.1 lipoprotein LppB [Mycolicibacterium mageritense DSM 44476 = CIP 104973]